MLRIIFDNIVFSLQKSGGISVVWYELLKRALTTEQLDCFFLEFVPSANIFRNMLSIPSKKIKEYSYSSLIYKRFLPTRCSNKSKFIFHSSYFRICSNPQAVNITTVHDFTYEYFYHGLMKKVHCWQKYYAIKNSKYVICISENTKRDLLKFLPEIEERKIRVIYNGVSDDYYPLVCNKLIDIPYPAKSYLLFVGERRAYKNFEFVVKSLKGTNYNLVIVGSELKIEEINLMETHISQECYHYAGRVSNQKLNLLYNSAAALVYPSAYEGFGIPVIEAQKAGCPVIAYNSSSIPEIIGDTPLLMNHLTVEEFYAKVRKLSDHTLMEKVINDGIRNSKRFSWDNMFEQLLEVYSEAFYKS